MRRAAQLLRFQTLVSHTQQSCVGHLEHIAAQEHHLLRSNRLQHLWLQQARSFAEAAPSSKTTSKSPVTFQTLFWTLFAGAGLVAGVRQYQDSKLKEAMSKSQQVGLGTSRAHRRTHNVDVTHEHLVPAAASITLESTTQHV
jgi:hypothetical protein